MLAWRSLIPRGVFILALAAALLLFAHGSTPGHAQGGVEKIDSYHVDIRIEANGDLTITEDIAYDFGSRDRHGIYRDVPTTVRYDDEFDRRYPLTVLSVTASPGTPAAYAIERRRDGAARIRIGDPTRTITGRHQYEIVYRIEDGLNGFTDHDELYWSAIGTDWATTIFEPSATVHLPEKLPADDVQLACFKGPQGSSLRCASATSDGATAEFTSGSLGSHEGLTVVVAFPKGLVPSPQPILIRRLAFPATFNVDLDRVVFLLLSLLSAMLRG